ncbi:MAG TPA: hypothetical protein VGF82_29015 [Terracidiphilus sp.]
MLSRSISAPVTPFPKFRLLGDLRQQFDGDVHISQPLGFREHAAEKNALSLQELLQKCFRCL